MSRPRTFILLLGDIFLLYVSLALTILIRYRADFFLSSFRTHIVPFSPVFAFWLFMFYLTDLYRLRTLRSTEAIFQRLAVSVVLGFSFSIFVFYLFGNFFRLTPRANLVLFTLIFFLLAYLLRILAVRLFASDKTSLALFGDSPLFHETIRYLRENPQFGYHVALYLPAVAGNGRDRLASQIISSRAKIVVVHPRLFQHPETVSLIYTMLPLDVNVVNFWDFYESVFEKVPLKELSEEWFVENMYGHRPLYDKTKRAAEFAGAGILFLALSPLFLLITLIIILTSRGPAIYRQQRIGKNGRIFMLYKFRTMKENVRGPLFTEANDKRVTLLGKVLRFTHLDEFPQLINIVKGDISVTGPRPERVELAKSYESLPYYDIRHIIKPGLTGWAQINFRPSASLEEAYEKLCYDIYYIKNRSLFLDFLIILKTIKYVFLNRW